MIFIFLSLFISIFLFVFITFYKKKYRKAFVAAIFVMGLATMLISSTAYHVHLMTFDHKWLRENQFINSFILNLKLSFSDIRFISLIGEMIVLYSIWMITNISLIKKTKFHLFFACLIVIYAIINNPEFLYILHLNINSPNITTSRLFTSIFSIAYGIKLFIVAVFFTTPFIVCLYKYFKYDFSIIRLNILVFGIGILLMELLIILLINTKYINSFFVLSTNLFYSGISSTMYTEKIIATIIGAFFIVLFFLILKSRLLNSYSFDANLFSVYGNSKRLDRTLRMILHTYKNMFLAINQLSNSSISLMGEEEKNKKHAVPIHSINNISKDALYNITHLLNMLGNIELSPQIIDFEKIIINAKNKIQVKENINFVINCPKEKFYIFSDEFYITDLVYNIIKNACDAVENVDNPEICITVKAESEWMLIEIFDNGCGIPKEIKKQIFNPLVSNKQGANNWGIGLYYAKRIVKAHHGHIFVKTPSEKGTTFEIFLPNSITSQILKKENFDE